MTWNCKRSPQKSDFWEDANWDHEANTLLLLSEPPPLLQCRRDKGAKDSCGLAITCCSCGTSAKCVLHTSIPPASETNINKKKKKKKGNWTSNTAHTRKAGWRQGDLLLSSLPHKKKIKQRKEKKAAARTALPLGYTPSHLLARALHTPAFRSSQSTLLSDTRLGHKQAPPECRYTTSFHRHKSSFSEQERAIESYLLEGAD